MNSQPDDILPRREKVKKIEFPESDERSVIVKANCEAVGFRLNCYRPEYLGRFVNKDTFNKTVMVIHSLR